MGSRGRRTDLQLVSEAETPLMSLPINSSGSLAPACSSVFPSGLCAGGHVGSEHLPRYLPPLMHVLVSPPLNAGSC